MQKRTPILGLGNYKPIIVPHNEGFDLNGKELPVKKEDYNLIFNNLRNKSKDIQTKGDKIFGKQKLTFISNMQNKLKEINDFNNATVNTDRSVIGSRAVSDKYSNDINVEVTFQKDYQIKKQ